MSVRVNRRPVVDPPISSVSAESDVFPGRVLEARPWSDPDTFSLQAIGAFNGAALLVLSRDDLRSLGDALISLAEAK